MRDVSGDNAFTIHRMLGAEGEGFAFGHNEDNPLPYDVIIIDEASMLEPRLALPLLKALKPGARILFVGDVDQLPSVGPGEFLYDLIECGNVPVTRLNVTHRQALDSGILVLVEHMRPEERHRVTDIRCCQQVVDHLDQTVIEVALRIA